MPSYIETAREQEGLEGYSDYEITQALHSMYQEETGAEVPFDKFAADAGLPLETRDLAIPPIPGEAQPIPEPVTNLQAIQPLPSHPIPEDMAGAPTLAPQPPDPGFGIGMSELVRQKVQRRDTMGEALSKAVTNTPERFKRIAGGLMEYLGTKPKGYGTKETFPPTWFESARAVISETDLANRGKELFDEATTKLKKNMPNVAPGSPEYYGSAILSSMIDMGPALTATYLTKNPSVGGAVMTGQVYGDKYAEQKRTGRSDEEATQDALFYAATEGLSEAIPLGVLTKAGGKILARTMKSSAAEAIQEIVNQGAQIGYDMGILDKDMSAKEAMRLMWDAGIIGAGAGGGLAIVTQPVAAYQEKKAFLTPKEYPGSAQAQAKESLKPEKSQVVATTPKQEEIEQQIKDTRELLQTAGESQKAEAENNLKRLEKTLTALKAEGVTEDTLRGKPAPEIQEKRGGKPLAESQAPAPSEPSEDVVAPIKDVAAPEPISEPKDEVKEVLNEKEKPLVAGAKYKTVSGRVTGPIPNIDSTTPRKSLNAEKRLKEWLKFEAIKEAKSRNDEFNLIQWNQLNTKNWSPADGDAVNLYLFGDANGRIGKLEVAEKEISPKKKPKSKRPPKGDVGMEAKPSDLPSELSSYSPGIAHQPMYQSASTVGYEAPESKTIKIGSRVVAIPKKTKPMRRESIRIALINIIGPRLYEGKVKGKSRLGFYRTDNSAVRVKRYGDIEVMAHEMAHYLDFHYKYKREFSKIYNRPDVVGEVKSLSYDTSTPELSKVEGFAEFVRLWLTRYESAKAQAPHFVEQFEAVLANDKKLGKKMRILQEKMHQWYFQGSEARLTAVMDGNKLSPKEKLDYMLHRRPTSMLKQRMVDHIHAAKVIERETQGKLLDATESAYKQLQLINGIEGIFAESTKRGAPYFDKDGDIQFKGPSLEDVFRFSITSGTEAFNKHQEYFAAKRAQELKGQGRENLFDEGMIQAGLNHAKKYPWFADSFKKYQEYRKNLMSFMVDTGYLDQQAAENMLKVNKNYVPFNRVVEGIGESFSGAGKSNFQRLKGGTQNIQNIYDNIVMGDFQHIKGALQAKALRQMFEAGLKSQDGSQFFTKIEADSELVKAQVDQMAGKVAEAMSAMGVTITNGGLVVSGNMDGTIVDQEQIIKYFEKNPEELMFWTFGNMPKTAETKVTSFISSRTGKRVWVEIQREAELVVDMLDNLNGWALPNGLAGKALGVAYVVKNMQTVLITSMPQFSIPNLVRDIQTATMISGGKFKPVYHNMLGFASMLGHGLKMNTAYTEMIANGGGWAGRVRSAMDETKGLSHHRMPGRWKKPELFLTNVLELYVRLIDSPEMSTRAGYYIQQRREGKSARESAWGAREISTDFRKHGSYAAFVMLQRTIPFHGAFVQSVDRDIRAFAEKDGETKFSNLWKTESGRVHLNDQKVRMAAVAASFATITLLLAAMNEDDNWYQDLTEDERVRFFHVKIDGEHYQIPKPHGFFSMILQGVETFMDYLTQKEGADASKVMAFSLAYNLNDQFLPGIINPHVEVALNKTFTGAPVVPKGLEGASPYLQYSQNTPQLYIAIGESLGISPAKARHISRGYFGYFENFVSDTAELALWNKEAWGERPFQSGAKQYFGKQFLPKDVPYRTRWTEKYYDMRARAVTARSDLALIKKRLPINSKLASKFEDEVTHLLSAVSKHFGRIDKNVSELREASMAIRYNKYDEDGQILSATEKETQINELRKEKNNMLKSAYKDIEKEIVAVEKRINASTFK